MKTLFISSILLSSIAAGICQEPANAESCQRNAIQAANESLTVTVNTLFDKVPNFPEAIRATLIAAVTSPLSGFLENYQSSPITALADLPPSIGSSLLVALKKSNQDGSERIGTEQMFQIVLDVTREVLPTVSTLRVDLRKC